jgi:hypothetical protein
VQPSPRALHQATRERLNAHFTTEWLTRAPFTSLHAQLAQRLRSFRSWPEPEHYDALAQSVPRPGLAERESLPRFVAQDRAVVARAGGYEQHVLLRRAVPTRAHDWHDFFNMVVWAHFPRLRWALNAVHTDRSHGRADPRNGRTHAQSVAAQLDESGMIVVSSSASLLQDLRALRFKRAFWERRAELLRTTRFWVVGHGTLESLLAPHLGLACKAILLEVAAPPGDDDAARHELDARVATLIHGWPSAPPRLDPVPVLGIPGHADNARPDFYDDPRYFRFQRRGAREAAARR